MPSSAKPVLYSFRRCPYAMRARLALQVAQIPCDLREVVLRAKPEHMLAHSPKGTVPILICQDKSVIEESLEIMLWALRTSDPQSWLGGSSLGETGKEAGPPSSDVMELIQRNDGPFKHHLDRYKYSDRYATEEGEVDHREHAAKILRELDRRLANWPWLTGPALSLADAAIAPFIRQFANTNRAWFDVQPWPALHSWLVDFLDSPLFASVMTKYPAWRAGHEAASFPESAHAEWKRRAAQ